MPHNSGFSLQRCSHCLVMFRADFLSRHIKEKHASASGVKQGKCPICKDLVKFVDADKHLLSHLRLKVLVIPGLTIAAIKQRIKDGLAFAHRRDVTVISEFRDGVSYIRCDCGVSVVSFVLGERKIKMEHGADGRLTGLHVHSFVEDDFEQVSVRAISGGAIDSNRRKH